MRHFNITELQCAPLTCIVHHRPVLWGGRTFLRNRDHPQTYLAMVHNVISTNVWLLCLCLLGMLSWIFKIGWNKQHAHRSPLSILHGSGMKEWIQWIYVCNKSHFQKFQTLVAIFEFYSHTCPSNILMYDWSCKPWFSSSKSCSWCWGIKSI